MNLKYNFNQYLTFSSEGLIYRKYSQVQSRIILFLKVNLENQKRKLNILRVKFLIIIFLIIKGSHIYLFFDIANI